MLKSTNAYFDTNKLYLVRPSIITKENEKIVKLEQKVENVDIAFVSNNIVSGLVNKRVYDRFTPDNINNNNLYFGVFDEDIDLLVEYLFKTHIGVEPTTEMIKGLFRNKPYYEIDEIVNLHGKITNIIEKFDDTKKVKKLSKF